ncbi:hypothetical protein OUZ56_018583 [Daphnia magna]|uniref:ZP domain-containing protein n=1 Tax=Daphnia magna TaxID=35525 RepID=A0ABQ9Z995_9CRUS|nr:hypothetical protein OUZ56_018583 [Daphnia magna]
MTRLKRQSMLMNNHILMVSHQLVQCSTPAAVTYTFVLPGCSTKNWGTTLEGAELGTVELQENQVETFEGSSVPKDCVSQSIKVKFGTV